MPMVPFWSSAFNDLPFMILDYQIQVGVILFVNIGKYLALEVSNFDP